MAEMSVAHTNVGQLAVPRKISFTEYATHFVTNLAQLSELRNITSPDDVLPVEVITFAVTNAQVEQPLASYIPQIWDKKISVNDKRTPAIFPESLKIWRSGLNFFKRTNGPAEHQ